jgi:hypothetical protein
MTLIRNFSVIFTVLFIFLSTFSVMAQGINVDFGLTSHRGRYMQNVGGGEGEDGQTIGMRIDRIYCAKSAGPALYFAIDNETLYQRPSSTSDIVNVEYFDDTPREIKLIYDAVDDPNKVALDVIKTTGSNTWKSASFYLEDSYFSDRQKYNADFRLECADTMKINVVSVVPMDYYVEYGDTNDEMLLTPKMVNAGDSMTEIVVVDTGEECITTTEESQYLYCDIDDDEIFEGDFFEYFISVEYFDADPATQFRLQYDGETEPYQSLAWAQGRGWGGMKTYTWEVKDGYMGNRQNDGADFRINFQQVGPPVNRIMVGFLDYGPSAVKNSPAAPVTHFSLEQNYPNPFNPTTTIEYQLTQQGHVSLNIYNLTGDLVRTLVNDERFAGDYSEMWDGHDDAGAPTSSGLYIYTLKADGFSQSKKMIKLK